MTAADDNGHGYHDAYHDDDGDDEGDEGDVDGGDFLDDGYRLVVMIIVVMTATKMITMVWLRLVAAVRREGSAQCNGIGVDNGITAGFGGGGHGEESIIQKRRT